MIVYCSSAWQPPSFATGQRKGGGPSTFMRYLGAYLCDHGHVTTNDPSADYDLHFVCSMTRKGLLKSLLRGIPIVMRLDGVVSAPNLSRYWHIYIKPVTALQSVTQITVYLTSFCRSSWSVLSGGTMQGGCVIIHNGADPSKFYPEAEDIGEKEGHTILLHEHYRHVDAGGLTTALPAFALVKEEMPETRLVLAGQLSGSVPEMVGDFLSQTRPAVAGSIEVIGRTDHSMVPDLIRSADVFVHPVANSACSHTVPEALACGVPVICYSGTGPAEFVGESGIVLQSEYEGVRHGFERFPREDPCQLADAIVEILKNKEAYRKKARARAHLFSSDITSQRYLEVFEEAVANPPEKKSWREASWLVSRLMMARALAKAVSTYEGLVSRR